MQPGGKTDEAEDPCSSDLKSKNCGICRSARLPDEHEDDFWIFCDSCGSWFHGQCARIEEFEEVRLETYHCAMCVGDKGPSIPKKVLCHHRHNYWDPDEVNKPMQTGTRAFIEQLKTLKFPQPTSEEFVIFEDGRSVTASYLEETEFKAPILIRSIQGLKCTLPDCEFSITDVINLVGASVPIDVIDVHRQQTYRTTLERFAELYSDPNPDEPFNLISLEITDTGLGDFVDVPAVVTELSWVNRYWPSASHFPEMLRIGPDARPKVSKFCLLSMANSFTDFHVDFGGTSVWYNVCRGSKVFYMAPPTVENLMLYESWLSDPDHTSSFLAERLTSTPFQVTVSQGETLLIPSGWIHAVYTPISSLVFGGNFLTTIHVEMQAKIYEMERRLRVSDTKFGFPNFEFMNWYAAAGILDHIQEWNEESIRVDKVTEKAAEHLTATLEGWVRRDQLTMSDLKNHLTDSITNAEVLARLAKELKINKKFSRSGKKKRKAGPNKRMQKGSPKKNGAVVGSPSVKLTIKPPQGPPLSPLRLKVMSSSHAQISPTLPLPPSSTLPSLPSSDEKPPPSTTATAEPQAAAQGKSHSALSFSILTQSAPPLLPSLAAKREKMAAKQKPPRKRVPRPKPSHAARARSMTPPVTPPPCSGDASEVEPSIASTRPTRETSIHTSFMPPDKEVYSDDDIESWVEFGRYDEKTGFYYPALVDNRDEPRGKRRRGAVAENDDDYRDTEASGSRQRPKNGPSTSSTHENGREQPQSSQESSEPKPLRSQETTSSSALLDSPTSSPSGSPRASPEPPPPDAALPAFTPEGRPLESAALFKAAAAKVAQSSAIDKRAKKTASTVRQRLASKLKMGVRR